MTKKPRMGIYGWGVVAPRSPDINTFRSNLASSETWMKPFTGFGPSNFLVGEPDFDSDAYRSWIEKRFKPARFAQFVKHSGDTARYAVGAFIQALEQNPGIEQTLQELGAQAHVYVGTGAGDLATGYAVSVDYYKAQRRWNRFWGAPERCALRREYLAQEGRAREALRASHGIPPEPRPEVDTAEAEQATETWEAFFCGRSEALQEYLAAAREIMAEGVGNNVKESVIKRKLTAIRSLNRHWDCPTEPWASVHPNLIWNIHNAPAAQVSMLGRITGPNFAPVGACASFGIALKLAQSAIRLGEAKAVVVGMTDPAPHPLLVGAFCRANVLAADGQPSKPLTQLKGTHIAGGAAVWIVGDREYMEQLGYQPLGMEIVGVALSADADHIITPGREGPLSCMRAALAQAGIEADQLASWDMHCTATPGDLAELKTARELLPDLPITARKGSFGHGMSVGGGWELTAQHIGGREQVLFPTVLRADELNPALAKLHTDFVFDEARPVSGDYYGKISMGVGGLNSCVISRRID